MVTDLLRRSPNWGPSILEGTLENLAEKAFVREIQGVRFLGWVFPRPVSLVLTTKDSNEA
jgi:hypothetical protein